MLPHAQHPPCQLPTAPWRLQEQKQKEMEELNRALAEMGLAPEAGEGADPSTQAAAEANGPQDEAAAARREDKKRRKAERLKQLQDAEVWQVVRERQRHESAYMLCVGVLICFVWESWDMGAGGLARKGVTVAAWLPSLQLG